MFFWVCDATHRSCQALHAPEDPSFVMISSPMNVMLIAKLLICLLLCFNVLLVQAQVNTCQDNCKSSDRLVGPFRMVNTRPHPWSQAVFPTNKFGFCQMGCQFFFTEFPVISTCKRLCDYIYRYQTTVSYSDLAETAISECRDGCDIALLVCQAGFYCTNGEMIPCPPGRYRESIPNLSILELNSATICKECPPGRYRPASKGKKPDDCVKCPLGKYAGVTGSVLVSDCKRCPAGKTSEEEGMEECKCINADSCALPITVPVDQTRTTRDYYADGVDFARETIPFIGRW